MHGIIALFKMPYLLSNLSCRSRQGNPEQLPRNFLSEIVINTDTRDSLNKNNYIEINDMKNELYLKVI